MQKLLYLLVSGTMIVSFVACSLAEEVNQQNVSSNNAVSSNISYDEPVTGIEYSYWLRLDESQEGFYEMNCNDVNYRLVYYGNYMTVYITNNGTEESTIGGEYHLQRLMDGEYVDLEDNVNQICGEVHVKDMQLIILHDDADGSEIILSGEEEQFTIAPGQTIKAEFLTMRYPIFDDPSYEGDYRFLYGDAVIDFKLYCDIVC